VAGDQGAGGGVSAPVAIIAAVARNRAIGAGGGMPWRLSSDLKRFRTFTWGKPLIMGRKTFDSIGRALPGRRVIVVTRDAGWVRPDVTTAPDLEAALARANEGAPEEIMIGGGGEIYALALPLARRLYLTEVDAEPEASVFFPQIDLRQWRLVRREAHAAGEKDDFGFAFADYERA
jgi:dihydrofolate reductase